VVTVLTERRFQARKRDLLVDEAFAALRARVSVLETQVLDLQHSVVDLTGARRDGRRSQSPSQRFRGVIPDETPGACLQAAIISLRRAEQHHEVGRHNQLALA
jgi:hypothetical protein